MSISSNKKIKTSNRRMSSYLPPGNNFIAGLGFRFRHGRPHGDHNRHLNPSAEIVSAHHLLATAGLSCQWIKRLQLLHGAKALHANLGGGQLPSVPDVPKPNKGTWNILWTILSILLPFSKPYIKQLQAIESEVEEVVECAAKVVEEVAEVVEKVAEEISEKLPEGSKLKEAALVVECVSKEAEKYAEMTINIIHEVDEFKEEVERRVKVELEQVKEKAYGI